MGKSPGPSACERIEKHLLAQIACGAFRVGDSLPSESVLAKQFRVSRIPVRQAIDRLMTRDLLRRVHGKGTFVCKAKEERTLQHRIAVLSWPEEASFFSSTFYAAIFSGIEAEASCYGQTLLFRSLRREVDHPATVLHSIAEDVDGIILVDLLPYVYRSIEATLRTLAIPVVVADYEGAAPDIDAVVFDNRTAMRGAVQLLLEGGHRDLVFLHRLADASGGLVSTFASRRRGFRDAIEDGGLVFGDSNVCALPPSTPAGPGMPFRNTSSADAEVLERLLCGRRPSAVVCASDHLALAVLLMAERLGIAVPQDLSVVGFGDIPEAQLVRPPLTTVHSPLPLLGATTVRRIQERLLLPRGATRIPYRVLLPSSLALRQSHRAITGVPAAGQSNNQKENIP